MTLALLKSFCSKDETRLILHEPCTRGAYTWATDGRILVRVPALPDVPEPIGTYPSVEKVWAAFNPNADFQPLPPLPEPLPEADVECEECDGLGITECPTCLQETQCSACDGDGSVIAFDLRWTRVGGHPFNIGLLQRIAALQNPRMAVAEDVKDGDVIGSMGSFVFDGGEGIVRGLKRRSEWANIEAEDANEWKPEMEARNL